MLRKKVFDEIWDQDKSVDDVIEQLGLKQISNVDEIENILNQVLKDNDMMVQEYKSGKDKAFNALIGQVMKASKGKANPGQVSQLLQRKIKKLNPVFLFGIHAYLLRFLYYLYLLSKN